MKKICVIGSFNIDITTSVQNLPKVGETVECQTFEVLIGGGKGGNQAVSCGRLGGNVSMVGCLGTEFFGGKYVDVLKDNNVDCSCVEVLQGKTPGTAFVCANTNGENLLFISKGTNEDVTVDYVKKYFDKIASCDIFLLQFEIPMETNLFLARELKKLGKTIILDPAPAKETPKELFEYVDYITPNEIEIEQITKMAVESVEQLQKACEKLLQLGVKTVVAKRGRHGAYVVNNEEFYHVDSYKCIKAVDTTAAGDTFNGAFALALSMGKSVKESVLFANGAAGISTTKVGAQKAMPTMEELEKFMNENING